MYAVSKKAKKKIHSYKMSVLDFVFGNIYDIRLSVEKHIDDQRIIEKTHVR